MADSVVTEAKFIWLLLFVTLLLPTIYALVETERFRRQINEELTELARGWWCRQ